MHIAHTCSVTARLSVFEQIKFINNISTYSHIATTIIIACNFYINHTLQSTIRAVNQYSYVYGYSQ